MKSFKNNLVWIIFMVFIIGTLVMLLTTGPDPLGPPPVPASAPKAEPPAAAEPAIDQAKAETNLAVANRSNRLRRLARVLTEQGEWDRALELHRQSLTLETRMDNPAGIAIQHDNIAQVFKAKGDPAKACTAWEAALRALGPAPDATRFSLKGQGAGERLRRRVLKSREENACPE
jgi:tetratricopeptide (TPR) repeat protein